MSKFLQKSNARLSVCLSLRRPTPTELTNSGEKRPREEKRKEWKRKGAASVRLRLLLLHVCAERAAAAAVVVVEVLAVGGVEPACFPAKFPKAGRGREGRGWKWRGAVVESRLMGVRRKKKKGWRRKRKKRHPYSSFHVRAEHGYTAGFSASCVCAQGVREGGGEKKGSFTSCRSLVCGREGWGCEWGAEEEVCRQQQKAPLPPPPLFVMMIIVMGCVCAGPCSL